MTALTPTSIEAACLLAWPALETVTDGHWVARFAGGYTKRANSIQCHDLADDADAGARIAAHAMAFEARALPPTFRVTPLAGPGIIAALDAKGWTMFEPSLVLGMAMTIPTRPVTARTRLFEPADPQWWQAQSAMAGYDAATLTKLSAILGQLRVPARGILTYNEAGDPVGAALAVNANGVAIFLNVVVDASARGQGFGRQVMHAGLNWTAEAGARFAAIQVLADNATALTLYRSLGFEELYGYHYRRPAA